MTTDGDGLIYQAYSHPVSQVVFRSGVSPCRRIATTSCDLVWEFCQMSLMNSSLVMPGGKPAVLVLTYLGYGVLLLRGILEFL